MAANFAPSSRASFGQLRDVAVRGQRLDAEFVRRAAHQIDRALADRAGRAEDRDDALAGRRMLLVLKGTAFIASPDHEAAADAVEAAARKSNHSREHDRDDETVEPVHQPAMAGE